MRTPFLLVVVFLTAVSAAQADVVAVVNGENVEYDSIKDDDKTLMEVDGSPLTEKERSAAARMANAAAVQDLIQKKIVEQTFKSSGVSMSSEELESAIANEPSFQAMTPEFLHQIQLHTAAQARAFKEHLKSPERSDAIYAEHLADFMPKQAWELLKQDYSDPERIDQMEALVPQSVDEWKKSTKGAFEGEALKKKLEEKISKDVVVEEDEVRRAYEKKYSDRKQPPFEMVRDEIKGELLANKKEKFIYDWWRERYQSAEIVIRDDRYKEVMTELLSNPS